MAESPPEEAQTEPPAATQPARKTYKRVSIPTQEEQIQEDSMNNCAVRTVLSGGMGMVLGVVFGIFMGTMDGAVSQHSHLMHMLSPKQCCIKNQWHDHAQIS